MIVEKEIRKEQETDRYEFFKLVDMTGADGKTVKVKQSVGTFTLGDLNNQKEQLTTQLKNVQDKLDAISLL